MFLPIFEFFINKITRFACYLYFNFTEVLIIWAKKWWTAFSTTVNIYRSSFPLLSLGIVQKLLLWMKGTGLVLQTSKRKARQTISSSSSKISSCKKLSFVSIFVVNLSVMKLQVPVKYLETIWLYQTQYNTE